MPKTILFFILIFSLNLFSQSNTEILVYEKNSSLCFYSVQSKINYPNVLKLGPTPNQIIFYNNNLFVINSGTWGAGTNLQIIPASAFFNYINNQDTVIFRNASRKLMLENNSNGFSATAFKDSLILVSLAQTQGLQIINFNQLLSLQTIGCATLGNPQGSILIDSINIAVCMADWGSGLGKYVSIFNTQSNTFTKNIITHKNSIDVIKLKNNDLISYSWGDWSGTNNFGTLHIIDKDSLGVKKTYILPNGIKANYVTQINDSTIYIYGFDSFYADKFLILNLNSESLSITESGFLKNRIVGKLKNGNYIVITNNSTSFFNNNYVKTDSLNFSVGNIICSVILSNQQICKSLLIQNGWNLISVPVQLTNMSINSVFPQAVSPAYYYNNGYFIADTLFAGKGYWIKFNQSQTIDLCGNSTNRNSVTVQQGWNLLAPFERDIPVSQITSIPLSIISSAFYEFNSSYLVTDTLKAGKSYWVKSISDGQLIFN